MLRIDIRLIRTREKAYIRKLIGANRVEWSKTGDKKNAELCHVAEYIMLR